MEHAQRLHYQTSLVSVPNDIGTNSVDHLTADSASSGPEAMISPSNRPPAFRSRSRSNSGEDEASRRRLIRQKALMVADSTRPSLLRRRKGKDLQPLKTSGIVLKLLF